MKYIRTKDRIYEEEKVNLIADAASGEIYVEKMINGFTSHMEQVTKQANTIEELVDGYYLDIDNHPFDSTQVYDKDELQRALEEKADWQSYSDRKYLEYEINLYAFIKTSKGLIYVAKMNDKGELCLI